MTEIDQEGLRSQLLALKAELQSLQEDSSEGGKPVELDQAKVGRLSRMDALQGQAMSLALQRRRQLELKLIKSALERIDSGDYGYCADCDEDIVTGRLDLDPAVTLCVACASEKEKRDS